MSGADLRYELRQQTSGALTLHHGQLLWGVNPEDVTRESDRLTSASYFSLQKQAGPPLAQARAASVSYRRQTSGGRDCFCFLGVSYHPDPDRRVKIRLGCPGDRKEGFGRFAEPLWRLVEEESSRWTSYPSGLILFEYARFHPEDSKLWAYELAVQSLLHLFEPGSVWPPTGSQAEKISAAFERGAPRREP